MNDFYQLMFEKGLSNIDKDDLHFSESDISHKALEEVNIKIDLLNDKVEEISLKIDELILYTNYVKFDHEYYITIDTAIYEAKQQKKFLLQDLEAAHQEKKRAVVNFKRKVNRIKKEVIEIAQKGDSLFSFMDL